LATKEVGMNWPFRKAAEVEPKDVAPGDWTKEEIIRFEVGSC